MINLAEDEIDYFIPDYLDDHRIPDPSSPNTWRLKFVQECYIEGTDNMISPEDINTLDPDLYKDMDPPSYFEVCGAASARDIQLDCLGAIDDTEYVVSCSHLDDDSQEDFHKYNWINACKVDTNNKKSLCYVAKVQDPKILHI